MRNGPCLRVYVSKRVRGRWRQEGDEKGVPLKGEESIPGGAGQVIERTLNRFTTLTRGLAPSGSHSAARTSTASVGRKPKIKRAQELNAPAFKPNARGGMGELEMSDNLPMVARALYIEARGENNRKRPATQPPGDTLARPPRMNRRQTGSDKRIYMTTDALRTGRPAAQEGGRE